MGREPEASASHLTADMPQIDRLQTPHCLPRYAVWRARDILDLPDLTGQVGDIGRVADDLHRGGQVQAFYYD